jgi:transglutaminase-like putative cysteine protease
MRIKAGFTIAYECTTPVPLLLMLSLRPEREADLITPQVLSTDRDIPLHRYLDGFGNVCTRTVIPPGRTTFHSDFLVHDSGLPDTITPDAPQHPVADLPDDVIVYLLASRYCETDLLVNTAWDMFGHVPPGWGRVQAIVDYVHKRIAFGYHNARKTRTAHEAHQDQVGVCRDYAHLAVALCRCMNIPARYCTGYLGDIGIEPIPGPMDFSAWFEVYLGGQWRPFDARHNKPRIGRILMAYGRDATDVAIATSFGPAELVQFDVVGEEAP